MEITEPDLYRRLSAPHESQEALETAFKAFEEELRALREKHRITDCVYVILANAKKENGEEQAICTMGHNGDPLRVEPMLTWALGMEKRRRAAMLKSLELEPD